MGFLVAAHCEGLDGTRLAIEEGVDTIEHGLELHRAPELLAALAESGDPLPTLSCFFDISKTDAHMWAPTLVELAKRQREDAHRTVAAARAAGVRMAMGFDSMPHGQSALELVRMHDAGLTALEAIAAATSVAADACGLGDEAGPRRPASSPICSSSTATCSPIRASCSTGSASGSSSRPAARCRRGARGAGALVADTVALWST